MNRSLRVGSTRATSCVAAASWETAGTPAAAPVAPRALIMEKMMKRYFYRTDSVDLVRHLNCTMSTPTRLTHLQFAANARMCDTPIADRGSRARCMRIYTLQL